MCYSLIGALAAWGLLKNARVVVPVLAVLFGAMAVITRFRPAFFVPFVGVLDDSMVMLGWVFMLGATAALYGHRIPLRHSYAAIASVVFTATLWLGWFHAIGIPALIYLTIWAAATLPSVFHRVGVKADYSYGLYLYGWPVEAALVAGGLSDKMIIFVPLSLLGAGLLAWASWHGIEKRAMKRRPVRASSTG